MRVKLSNATITWPQDKILASIAPSAASTPRHKFVLVDFTLDFPIGELSLICGKLGTFIFPDNLDFLFLSFVTFFRIWKDAIVIRYGRFIPATVSKSHLIISGLLGEADLLSGGLVCPRSPPDALAAFAELSFIPEDEWVVPGICAYVPQTAWLLNASIKDNILFHLPYDEKRYKMTLEVRVSLRLSLVAHLINWIYRHARLSVT